MATERLHHLDLLRASMMFLGVAVHATHADYDLGEYEWIRFLSGSFRMACFFVISGYFAHMALERYGPHRFLLRRSAALGIPAVFSVLLLNPSIIEWMTEYFATAPVPATPNINWHGPMWFLFVLLAFSLATRFALRPLERARERLARRSGPGPAALLIVAAMTGGAIIGGKLLEKLAPTLPGFEAYGWIAQATFIYLPYFGVGLMMYGSVEVSAFAHSRPWAWGLAAFCALAARHLASRWEVSTLADHLAHVTIDYAAGFSCSLALMGAARRLLRGRSRLVSFAAESAYTLYVVHYFFIAFALVQAARVGLPMPVRALLSAGLAIAAGLAIHAVLVRRLPLVALLLNGRLPAPRAEAFRARTAAGA